MKIDFVQLLGHLVFISVFLVYKSTSFPGIPGGDSGELLAEACQQGCAHPPGYPLFIILMHEAIRCIGNRFDSFGISSPAQIANVMNSLFGALSTMFVYFCIVRWNESKGITEVRFQEQFYVLGSGVLGACFFAFSPLTWEYNVGAEVFALNNMLVSMMLYYTVMVFKSDKKSQTLMYACLGAFVCGCALANQHASILFIIPLICSVMFNLLSLYKSVAELLRPLSICFLFFWVGLLPPYLFLVISHQHGAKPGSWGDLSTLQGVMKHVLRMEYGTFKMLTFGNKDQANASSNMPHVESAIDRVFIHFNDLIVHQRFRVGIVFIGISVVGIVANLGLKWFSYMIDDIKGTSPIKIVPANQGKRRSKKSSTTQHDRQLPTSSTSSQTSWSGKLTDYESISLTFLVTLIFYIVIWNSVLSNLKLSVPMAYAVHSRFWIQPNLLLCIFMGDGANRSFCFIVRTLNTEELTTANQYKEKVHSEEKKIKREKEVLNGLINKSLLSRCATLAVSTLLVLGHFEKNYSVSNQRRDAHGWTMQRYGEATLAVLPPGALLLSHTDLDWNTVRYLRICEKQRQDIVHLSVQLLPYPWFTKQHDLYEGVVFPPISSGVSTHKMDQGNGKLIEDFILANYDKYGGDYGMMEGGSALSARGTDHGTGIFLDMQAVAENMIGSRGAWRSLVLVPHGNLFRVYKQPSYSEDELVKQRELEKSGNGVRALGLELTSYWMKESIRSLEVMKHYWQNSSSGGIPPLNRFASGTWEFAVTSVYWDAHYQLSLYLLTYALDLAEGISLAELPSFASALKRSVELLDEVTYQALGVPIHSPQDDSKSHTLSSSKKDVLKNSALAHVRYQSAISIFNQNQDLLLMLDEDMKKTVSTELKELSVTRDSLAAVSLFLQHYPQDKDARVFQGAVEKYSSLLSTTSSLPSHQRKQGSQGMEGRRRARKDDNEL